MCDDTPMVDHCCHTCCCRTRVESPPEAGAVGQFGSMHPPIHARHCGPNSAHIDALLSKEVPRYVGLSQVGPRCCFRNPDRLEYDINKKIYDYYADERKMALLGVLNNFRPDPRGSCCRPDCSYATLVALDEMPKRFDRFEEATYDGNGPEKPNPVFVRSNNADLLRQWAFKGFTGD